METEKGKGRNGREEKRVGEREEGKEGKYLGKERQSARKRLRWERCTRELREYV